MVLYTFKFTLKYGKSFRNNNILNCFLKWYQYTWYESKKIIKVLKNNKV